MKRVTADTITNAQIAELYDYLRQGRQNAHKRSIRKDCNGAVNGSRACLESVAASWNKWNEQRHRPTNKYVCGQPCPNLGKPECVHTPRRSKWWGTRRCRDAGMHVDFGMHKATSRRNLRRQ